METQAKKLWKLIKKVHDFYHLTNFVSKYDIPVLSSTAQHLYLTAGSIDTDQCDSTDQSSR